MKNHPCPPQSTLRRLGTILLLALPASVSGSVILNETFPIGQRLVQDLPNTAAWYGSGATSLGQTAGGSIVSDSAFTVLTYFTDSGTVSLAVGEILNVSFDFQLPNPPPTAGHSGIRAGVMNSTTGGGRISDDGFGNGNAAFVGYTGYGGWIHPQGADTRLRERTDMTISSLLSNNNTWTNLDRNTLDSTNILADTTYTGVFLISRTADSVVANFIISGPNFDTVTMTYDDVGSSLHNFDTFAIWTNASHVGDSISLSRLEVSVIPEPSAYAAAAGLLAAVVLVFRRRRANRV